MRLAVDANIVFAALLAPRGTTASILFSERLKLFAPEYLLEELAEYENSLRERAGYTKEGLRIALEAIPRVITLVGIETLRPYIEPASNACPDKHDVNYFALAMKLRCPLWSNDRRLKTQREVEVLDTAEVIRLLEKGATRRRH